jgi:hypothetical protein
MPSAARGKDGDVAIVIGNCPSGPVQTGEKKQQQDTSDCWLRRLELASLAKR